MTAPIRFDTQPPPGGGGARPVQRRRRPVTPLGPAQLGNRPGVGGALSFVGNKFQRVQGGGGGVPFSRGGGPAPLANDAGMPTDFAQGPRGLIGQIGSQPGGTLGRVTPPQRNIVSGGGGGDPAPVDVPSSLRPLGPPPPGGLDRGPTQPFSPESNLIGTQINPAPFEASPEALRARELTGQNLESLSSAPSRQELAEQSFARLGESLGEARTKGIQDIGRKAAAFGRIGSGVTTTNLGDLGERLGTIETRERGRLAGETAGLEFGDRLARLGATQGVGGQLFNQDLGRAGFEQTLRGETRGERGFQVGEEQRGIDNRVRQRFAEEDLRNSDFGRRMQELNLTGRFGFNSVNPLELAIGNQFGQGANDLFGGSAELLRQRARAN